jgi:hypothetical protein
MACQILGEALRLNQREIVRGFVAEKFNPAESGTLTRLPAPLKLRE